MMPASVVSKFITYFVAVLIGGTAAVFPISATTVPLVHQPAENTVPLCFMLPLLIPSPLPANDHGASTNPVGVVVAYGMMLAAQHINDLDCSVLGPGCTALLKTGGDGLGQVAIQPLIVNYDGSDSRGAPRAVQACTGTDAEFLLGAFSSEHSTQVSTFIGGLGNTYHFF
jgi:hypothetical protein